MTDETTTSVAFPASVDHTDDVACCDGFIPAGELIVISPDGSAWHPACAVSAGFTTPGA